MFKGPYTKSNNNKGLVWGVKVVFHYCAAGGDTMETSVRSCVLSTILLRQEARMGSFVVGEDTQSIPFDKHHLRGCMGMWLSNGLHHMWCGAGQCYFVSEECACKLCGCDGVDKYHPLRCQWASCEQMNRDNIGKIVKVLHACNRHT